MIFFIFLNTPLAPPYVIILMSIVEKKLNKNYVGFDFRMGTVLVNFLVS